MKFSEFEIGQSVACFTKSIEELEVSMGRVQEVSKDRVDITWDYQEGLLATCNVKLDCTTWDYTWSIIRSTVVVPENCTVNQARAIGNILLCD